jgi:hypothetical protein
MGLASPAGVVCPASYNVKFPDSPFATSGSIRDIHSPPPSLPPPESFVSLPAPFFVSSSLPSLCYIPRSYIYCTGQYKIILLRLKKNRCICLRISQLKYLELSLESLEKHIFYYLNTLSYSLSKGFLPFIYSSLFLSLSLSLLYPAPANFLHSMG